MNQNQIEDDIKAIVSGQFTEDALGPERYNEILNRVRARSSRYLDAFESMFLGLAFDAIAQSHLYLPNFLELLRVQTPERVVLVARNLLKQYDAVMIVYDKVVDQDALKKLLPEEIVRLLLRLEARRTRLHVIIR